MIFFLSYSRKLTNFDLKAISTAQHLLFIAFYSSSSATSWEILPPSWVINKKRRRLNVFVMILGHVICNINVVDSLQSDFTSRQMGNRNGK